MYITCIYGYILIIFLQPVLTRDACDLIATEYTKLRAQENVGNDKAKVSLEKYMYMYVYDTHHNRRMYTYMYMCDYNVHHKYPFG